LQEQNRVSDIHVVSILLKFKSKKIYNMPAWKILLQIIPNLKLLTLSEKITYSSNYIRFNEEIFPYEKRIMQMERSTFESSGSKWVTWGSEMSSQFSNFLGNRLR